MFRKVLVANRGEIAVRVIRTLREMGIASVAVHSEADRHCRHVAEADEAIAIGPSPAAQSYLAVPAILEAARAAGADAIHPGYGFLSENAAFCRACAAAGVAFIGPTPANMEVAGDKLGARRALAAVGVPMIPGTDEPVRDARHGRSVADALGYPVMLKAASGGGGRGLRQVAHARALDEALVLAQGEARAAFGDPTIYLEKRIEGARHIEVQVLGDGQGKAIHLGERNCSIQRRHQKMIEEAPAPRLRPGTAAALHATAVGAVSALKYLNAGTVEFLVDREGRFYFLEINARIQVEHPVTEAITGLDIVRTQLEIASTGALPFGQPDVRFGGHAIECRINAEDPDFEFMPQPGPVHRVRWPEGDGIRIDTHLYEGYDVPIFYDSLLAKLVVHGASRPQALDRLQTALAGVEIGPIKTTVPFLRKVVLEPEFVDGSYDLGLVSRLMPELEEEELEGMTPDWFDLQGKTALVVGASRGLGREAALALARAGADVICAARSKSDVEATAASVAALGRRSLALTTDAGDDASLTSCIEEAAGFGRLDVLVYAAGVMHAAAALDTATADWDRLLRVNLTGALVAARHAGRHMRSAGGRMIFFGTAFVGCVLPFTVAYGVAKAGLHQMVQSLALEWARYGITVNAVAPGYFETDMPKAVMDNPDLRQRVLNRIPLRRFGQPPEIGPLVTYLASDASAFMTGAVLRIDGGQSLNVS